MNSKDNQDLNNYEINSFLDWLVDNILLKDNELVEELTVNDEKEKDKCQEE